jgi:hypothetical protein
MEVAMKYRISLCVLCALLIAAGLLFGWVTQSARTAAAFQDAFNRGKFTVALQMVDDSELAPSDRQRFE